MDITRNLQHCPDCEGIIPTINNVTFCPFCGVKLPEREIIPLEKILIIAIPPQKDGQTISVITKNTFNNAFLNVERVNTDLSQEELLSYVNEHRDSFIEISSKAKSIPVYYINKIHLANRLTVEYVYEYDESTIDGISVDIVLYNTDKRLSFSFPSFYFNTGIGFGAGNNTAALCAFVDLLYKTMIAFSLIPTIEEEDNSLNNDFCPYGLRDVVENTITQFSEEHPEEYATALLLKEVK